MLPEGHRGFFFELVEVCMDRNEIVHIIREMLPGLIENEVERAISSLRDEKELFSPAFIPDNGASQGEYEQFPVSFELPYSGGSSGDSGGAWAVKSYDDDTGELTVKNTYWKLGLAVCGGDDATCVASGDDVIYAVMNLEDRTSSISTENQDDESGSTYSVPIYMMEDGKLVDIRGCLLPTLYA